MTTHSSVCISSSVLNNFSAALFQAADVSPAEAELVATSLVDSNLCGHESHGVMRVMEYLDSLSKGELIAGAAFEVVNQTGSVLVCDGHFGFGQVQMRRLIERLIPMAREQGVACGTLRRCGHVGRLGEWVERIAQQQLAGLMSVNDNGVLMCVAPPGGTQARLSTNPIALGVPTADDPLVLDISTSMVANGKVRVAQVAGRACPEGWLLDANGQPTTDPQARFANPPGTILPMGGYKGFGLGLLFDVLVGGLSGGFSPPAPAGEVECNNVLLMVFDPKRFSGSEHFIVQSQELSDFVRATPTRTPADKIRLPNDRARQSREERLADGVPLDHGTWSALCERATQLGVSIPQVTSLSQ
jgi:uncharacterized oxidoreductase